MENKLLFRRQFLLSKKALSSLNTWRCTEISRYYLYTHPDVDVNINKKGNSIVVLIGDIFDYIKTDATNNVILDDVMESYKTGSDIFSSIKKYAGCYSIIVLCGNEHLIFSDARGLHEIYYTLNNDIVCGSQPNLIKHGSSEEIKPANDPLLQGYYNKELYDSRWIGENTYFEGVKHLLPNHYLDLLSRKSHRYWPNTPILPLTLKEAVPVCCEYLQGAMKAISQRSDCMMALTAGIDSRTLLAASKSILDKLYFFINDRDLGLTNPDVTIPEQIVKKNDLNFNVQIVSNKVDNEFRKIFYKNVFLADERLLPSIYNVFYKNHQEKTVILGVGEIGRTFYGTTPKKMNAFLMAYKLGYTKSNYVLQQCEQLIDEYVATAKKCNVNPMALLYWEQRLGNWGATRNSESNIAVKKIDPYNSHFLYETFQRVEEKYRFYGQGSCILFNELIKYMWPELMNWPINPPVNFHEAVSFVLNKAGVFSIAKSMKYQLCYIKYILNKK